MGSSASSPPPPKTSRLRVGVPQPRGDGVRRWQDTQPGTNTGDTVETVKLQLNKLLQTGDVKSRNSVLLHRRSTLHSSS